MYRTFVPFHSSGIAQFRAWLRDIVPLFLVFLAAMIPRIAYLDRFVTVDEVSFWIHRSEAFLGALRQGDFAATAIASHPGVTTMWLGSIGLIARDLLATLGVHSGDSMPERLALLRWPVALVHIAGVTFGFIMLRQLLPWRVALLAAMFWALDPFVVAYSRVLHVDALAGTFATLSLLAVLVAVQRQHAGWLLVSGVCGALAALSKSPAFVVAPLTLGFLVLAQRLDRRASFPVWRWLAYWAGAAALTVMVCWPAVWAAPAMTFDLLRFGVEHIGGQPHELGNFFLGREDLAPGWLYYPVALALRSTPLTLLGVLLLAASFWRVRGGFTVAQWRMFGMMALFIIAFMATMSIFPKKFDRYLVPVFPAFDILAAAGLVQSAGLFRIFRRSIRPVMYRAGLGLLCLLAILNLWQWRTYEISAFNQILGGTLAGVRTFQSGWGEGMEQVADWLNQQPDITGVVVMAQRTEVLQPYLRHGAQATYAYGEELPPNTGYVVVYLRYVQHGSAAPPFDQFFGRAPPAHVVSIHGVPYAWIYQVPQPVEHPLPAMFGDVAELRGYTLDDQGVDGDPELKLFWASDDTPERDYALFVHMIGADGQRIAQIDLPLHTGSWEPHRYPVTPAPLRLPRDMPAGDYQLCIGLYPMDGGVRAPLSAPAGEQCDQRVAGPDALLLTTMRIR